MARVKKPKMASGDMDVGLLPQHKSMAMGKKKKSKKLGVSLPKVSKPRIRKR